MANDLNFLTVENNFARPIALKVTYLFKGECGKNVDKIELYAEAFKFGEARIKSGTWECAYEFKGQGERKLRFVAYSKGILVAERRETALVNISQMQARTEKTLMGIKVAIDCGHGYDSSLATFDVGATGNGVKEVDLNHRTGLGVKEALEKLGATVDVYYYDNPNLKLNLRQKGGKAAGHDCFVSIHHNAFNLKAQGFETLVLNQGQASQGDKILAEKILAALKIYHEIPSRGVKEQSLGVLKGVPSSVPCCLVECFFIDGPLPVSVDEMVAKSVKSISRGIEDYFLWRKADPK
jgi:N-acetylmuramoyl-L-alanine amidase